MAAISAEWDSLNEMSQQMISTSLGIVDAKLFCEAIQSAHDGKEVRIVTVMRTLGIESWIRTIRNEGILVPHPSSVVDTSAVLPEPRPLAEPPP